MVTLSPWSPCHLCPWPFSHAHDRLILGLGQVSGWEAPDWFAPPGVDPKDSSMTRAWAIVRLTTRFIIPQVDKYSWGRHNWFPYWEVPAQ